MCVCGGGGAWGGGGGEDRGGVFRKNRTAAEVGFTDFEAKCTAGVVVGGGGVDGGLVGWGVGGWGWLGGGGSVLEKPNRSRGRFHCCWRRMHSTQQGVRVEGGGGCSGWVRGGIWLKDTFLRLS